MEEDLNTKFKELLNARPLDVHTWSDYSEVNVFVDDIYQHLTSIKGNERINKKLLKVLLLDLYVAWCADPDLKIMFSRDNNAYKAKSRYNEIHIGKKIIEVVDELVNAQIILEQIGFNDRINGIGFQSRLWASDDLKTKFKKAKFSKFQIHDHENREPIVLKYKNKKLNDNYKDTHEVSRMRKVLTDYNSLLSKTHIDVADLEKPVIEIGEGKKTMRLQIDQRDKYVRRIFNNNRWDQGGRFYGGWWHRCPRAFRERITFDDIPGFEVDFSGLHIVILYAKENINYWAEINEDPYLLNGIDDLDPSLDLRATAKLLMLTAINAKNEIEAFGAFRQQAPRGSPERRLTNKELGAILSNLKRKHKPIAHKIASGAGIDLMYADSQITEKLIEKFTYEYRCPMLTVHDSYVVPWGYDRILARDMQIAFEQITGISSPIVQHTTEYSDTVENEPDPKRLKRHSENSKLIPSRRHLKDWEEFKSFKRKPIREDWVLEGTMVY